MTSAWRPSSWPTRSWTYPTSWSIRNSTICRWPTILLCYDSSSRQDADPISMSSACLIRARFPRRKEHVASSLVGDANSKVYINHIYLVFKLMYFNDVIHPARWHAFGDIEGNWGAFMGWCQMSGGIKDPIRTQFHPAVHVHLRRRRRQRRLWCKQKCLSKFAYVWPFINFFVCFTLMSTVRETEEVLLYVKKKANGSRWVLSASASAVDGPICRAFTRDYRLSTDGSTRRSAVSKPCPVNKTKNNSWNKAVKKQNKGIFNKYLKWTRWY